MKDVPTTDEQARAKLVETYNGELYVNAALAHYTYNRNLGKSIEESLHLTYYAMSEALMARLKNA